jgi:hypothetical protein
MPDTPGSAAPRRRGRPARTAEAAPTGYRATSATRRQLEMARQFTGHSSLQAIIDAAVRGYLTGLARSTPAYRSALESLDSTLLTELDPADHDEGGPTSH